MRLQPHWLKKSVLLPVALAMIVTSVILLVLLLAVLSHGAKQEFERDFTTIRASWHNGMEHHVSQLHALSAGLMHEPALRNALIARDANAIGRIVVPLFARLQNDYGVANLTLLTADGRVLFGLHHTALIGERMKSAVLRQTMNSGIPQAGLELDASNTLRLLGASPWRNEERLLGYIVLGAAFEQLAGELDQLFGMQHMITLTALRTGSDDDLMRLPSSLVAPPGALTSLLRRDRIQELEAGVALERADKWFFAGAIPLADVSDAPIGWLVTLRDVSDVRAALLLGVGTIALVTFTILTLLLFFLHHITQGAERLLAESERELQQTLDALETAHAEWVDSFDAIEQPIFIHDDLFRVIRANRTYAERAGMPFHELLGKPYWEVFPRNGGPLPGCAAAMHGGDRNEEEVRLHDGSVYISRSFPIRDDQGGYRYSIHVLQDVTQLEQITSTLQHEMRARRTISASNQALIHADSEEGLLQEVCRIATEEGGNLLAWAAYKRDDEARSLHPVGASGITLDELRQLNLSWHDEAAQHMLSAQAIRSGEVALAHDIQNDDDLPQSAALARRLGYASAAALPLRTGEEVLGVLFIAAATPHAFTTEEIGVLQELAGDLAYGIDALRGRRARISAEQAHLGTLERLKSLLGNTVLALSTAVEARDPYTAGHQQRVMDLAVNIARELGWEEARVEALGIAALVHDVGNIYVPAEILSKPGKLSPLEFELVKNHPHIGYKILNTIDFPWPIADMVLQHHELLDGTGYPSGLKNGAILPEAQVIGVAGAVEAMASHRPYRPALGITAALEQLERHRGLKFDPLIVDTCLGLFRDKGYRLIRNGEGLSGL